MPEWRVYVRDEADLKRLAEIDDYQSLTLVPRFNVVGAWTLDLDINALAAAYIGWGTGIVVTLDGVEFFSGPLTQMTRKWNAHENRLVLAGVDDTVWLKRRLAFPEAPALTTATNAYDVRTGLASTVMAAYVDANAGPGSDVARRVPGLTLATDYALGTPVTGRGRFQALLDLLAELALLGGDLGFRVVQSGSARSFQVYAPTDKTRAIVFTQDHGNLAEFEYTEKAPNLNFVVVGGAGDANARTFYMVGDTTSVGRYGRIESLVDTRDTSSTAELAQSASQELGSNANGASLAARPVDTASFAFGTDYGLGDRVTVIVDGEPVQDVIREVQIRLTPDEGVVVDPIVGTPGERDPRTPQLFTRLAELEKQVRDLQRRK